VGASAATMARQVPALPLFLMYGTAFYIIDGFFLIEIGSVAV
jgi:hypothetical protein